MKTLNNLARRTNEKDCGEKALQKLVKAPETANQIYELAESFFARDANVRLTLTDIERVQKYLRQAETDAELMNKQLQDLALIENGFSSDKVPIGF